VQCAQGCDRSVTFIICMLYHMTKIDSSTLIDFVNRKRRIANTFQSEDNITNNFRRALKAFA
jgi:hypothetical protein